MRTTTRALRANLSDTLARAAKGEEVIVTRRGRPYVRVLAAGSSVQAQNRYPLRGCVVRMAEDFDKPLDELWDALR
jgi:prevent-host-death family protein